LGKPLKDEEEEEEEEEGEEEEEEEEDGEIEDKRVDVVGPSDEIINSCSQLSQLSLKPSASASD